MIEESTDIWASENTWENVTEYGIKQTVRMLNQEWNHSFKGFLAQSELCTIHCMFWIPFTATPA